MTDTRIDTSELREIAKEIGRSIRASLSITTQRRMLREAAAIKTAADELDAHRLCQTGCAYKTELDALRRQIRSMQETESAEKAQLRAEIKRLREALKEAGCE